MGKGKPRHKSKNYPTPRQRFFDKEFKLGDKVAIIRADHGWFDGRLTGVIRKIDPMWCSVKDDEDGFDWLINHPRDITKL